MSNRKNCCSISRKVEMRLSQWKRMMMMFAMEEDEDDEHRMQRASHFRRVMETVSQILSLHFSRSGQFLLGTIYV